MYSSYDEEEPANLLLLPKNSDISITILLKIVDAVLTIMCVIYCCVKVL